MTRSPAKRHDWRDSGTLWTLRFCRRCKLREMFFKKPQWPYEQVLYYRKPGEPKREAMARRSPGPCREGR